MYGKLSASGESRQRRQCARVAVDRVDVHRIRLGPRRRVQKAAIGAHRHRHDHARRLGARARLQLARVEHPIGADVAVLGVRDVDECCRQRRRGADKRCHRTAPAIPTRSMLHGFRDLLALLSCSRRSRTRIASQAASDRQCRRECRLFSRRGRPAILSIPTSHPRLSRAGGARMPIEPISSLPAKIGSPPSIEVILSSSMNPASPG